MDPARARSGQPAARPRGRRRHGRTRHRLLRADERHAHPDLREARAPRRLLHRLVPGRLPLRLLHRVADRHRRGQRRPPGLAGTGRARRQDRHQLRAVQQGHRRDRPVGGLLQRPRPAPGPPAGGLPGRRPADPGLLPRPAAVHRDRAVPLPHRPRPADGTRESGHPAHRAARLPSLLAHRRHPDAPLRRPVRGPAAAQGVPQHLLPGPRGVPAAALPLQHGRRPPRQRRFPAGRFAGPGPFGRGAVHRARRNRQLPRPRREDPGRERPGDRPRTARRPPLLRRARRLRLRRPHHRPRPAGREVHRPARRQALRRTAGGPRHPLPRRGLRVRRNRRPPSRGGRAQHHVPARRRGGSPAARRPPEQPRRATALPLLRRLRPARPVRGPLHLLQRLRPLGRTAPHRPPALPRGEAPGGRLRPGLPHPALARVCRADRAGRRRHPRDHPPLHRQPQRLHPGLEGVLRRRRHRRRPGRQGPDAAARTGRLLHGRAVGGHGRPDPRRLHRPLRRPVPLRGTGPALPRPGEHRRRALAPRQTRPAPQLDRWHAEERRDS
ncbi:hypothetical protein SDIAM26S_01131 [Streptomyces diastaticus subsp. diastaticus]